MKADTWILLSVCFTEIQWKICIYSNSTGIWSSAVYLANIGWVFGSGGSLEQAGGDRRRIFLDDLPEAGGEMRRGWISRLAFFPRCQVELLSSPAGKREGSMTHQLKLILQPVERERLQIELNTFTQLHTSAVLFLKEMYLPGQKGHGCSVGDGHHSGDVRDLWGRL